MSPSADCTRAMHRPSADGVTEDAAAANGFLLVILGAARLSTRWPVHHRVGGDAGGTAGGTATDKMINKIQYQHDR